MLIKLANNTIVWINFNLGFTITFYSEFALVSILFSHLILLVAGCVDPNKVGMC